MSKENEKRTTIHRAKETKEKKGRQRQTEEVRLEREKQSAKV
jgi:hypothetical protein